MEKNNSNNNKIISYKKRYIIRKDNNLDDGDLTSKDDLNISIEGMNTCFSDYSGCYKKGYRYYNKTNKICTENCDGKKVFNLNNKETIDEGGNCFSNCPSNYPYYDDSIKGCVKKCNSFIDQNECVTDCKSRNKFHFENEYECLGSCSEKNYSEIYYDEETNICYYSCKDSLKTFTSKRDNYPKKCYRNCINGDIYKFYND